MNKLGDKIYFLRKQCGISQEELGYKLGVSRQTVSKWETGTAFPDAKNLIQLSEFFNISVESLYKDCERTDENVSTKLSIKIIEQKEKNKKYKSILLITLLIILIIFACGLILAIVLIGISIYSSSVNKGVESVSFVLFNISLLDVMFICFASFLVVIFLISLIIYMIHKNN